MKMIRTLIGAVALVAFLASAVGVMAEEPDINPTTVKTRRVVAYGTNPLKIGSTEVTEAMLLKGTTGVTNVTALLETVSGTVTPVGRIVWTNRAPVYATLTLLDGTTNPVSVTVCTAEVATVYAAISNVTVTVSCATNVAVSR